MPVKCCVASCKLQTDDLDVSSVSFHKLPARENLREQWLKILKKHCSSIGQKYLHVCSQHFERECFQYSGLCKRRMLKSGSVPTIFSDFEILKCTKQSSVSPKLESQNSLNRSVQCDSSPFTNQHIDFSPKQSEHSGNLLQTETDCQSKSGSIKIDSTYTSSDNVLEHTTNNTDDNEKTKIEKRQQHQIVLLQRRNETLIKRLARCRKRMYHFKFLFETLKRGKYISDDQNASLQKTISVDDRKIFENIINSKRSKVSLPSCLRKFACTLDFYSPKAYSYVRNTYMKCLPHPKTVSRWYRKVHIDSGVSKCTIAAVKNKVSQSNGPIFCNLVFDEMSIKKKNETINGIEYGYVDVGKGDAADNAFVCMLVCINGNWKIPISYYFITSLNATQKRDIVDETLRVLDGTGVKIVSLTFVGPKCNLSMCNLLGANLNIDGEMQNYFYHPITNEPIFIILDACHSLKSVRNSVAKGDKDMYDDEGNVISWSYYEKLIFVQHKHAELYLAHKMTDDHINWKDNIMNVRLAAQTFSQSVSDSLHYLEYETDISDFKGAAGTSKFSKIMNDAFDILNSRSLCSKDPSKIGIRSDNIEVIEKKVEIIVNYIRGLKYLDRTRVVDGLRKTGFIGIMLGLRSVIGIFKHFVQKEVPHGYLLTYKLSQDHLEIFFSAVRSKGGHNNNPTCRLFISIYKQLLLHADIKGSEKGNCVLLDDTALLTISNTSYSDEQKNEYQNFNDGKKMVLPRQNKYYIDDAVSYTAGFVCRKILRMSKCFICPLVLTHQPEEIDHNNNETVKEYRSKLIDIKNRGGLIYPSADVISICKLTENIFKTYYISKKGIFRKLVQLCKNKVPQSCLQISHPYSEKVNESDHRFQLIIKIISLYLQMRINKYEKRKQRPKKRLRRLYTKYILFNHE